MAKSEHPVFIPPDDPNIRIWRYMDFTKFVSMLEHGGLFFSRADLLGDSFEGSFSRANQRMRPDMYKEYSDNARELLLGETMIKFRRNLRHRIMINCWHMNNYESAAMWKLYTKSSEAVAIQSTYAQLRDLLDEQVLIGIVHYIDYETEWIAEDNALYPFMRKRKSFEYEHELRAVIQNFPESESAIEGQAKKLDLAIEPTVTGIWKAISLSDLIEKIYVAPTSPEWLRELIEKVVLRYRFEMPVIQSSLDEEPFF